ncbi:MAG: hypothetical protein AB1791_00175 [Chloroflexota bacterium]
MDAEGDTPSPVLLEANRRLYELRARVSAERQAANLPAERTAAVKGQPVEEPSTTAVNPSLVVRIATLPDHLGWESTAVTAAIRAARRRTTDDGQRMTGDRPPATCHLPPATPDPKPSTFNLQPSADEPYVKVYPAIALGILGQGQEAAGRVWLLLHHLDAKGQGWLRIDLTQEKLTNKNSNLYICGRRQLRNLLRQGRGVFWEQDKERLWIKSAAKVAAALGVERLSGRPVAVPISALLAGIGRVRAHLYASFHSGRTSPQISVRNLGVGPISRATLQHLTHVPERTQRVYEQTAGVTKKANIAIGEPYTEEGFQEEAWRHGRATFQFVDHQGQHGQPGRTYVAWRLPNSYTGSHIQQAKGRQKKINRQIDLVKQAAQGNGRPQVVRLFHPNGAMAGKVFNRNADTDAYWPHSQNQSGRHRLWEIVPARRK